MTRFLKLSLLVFFLPIVCFAKSTENVPENKSRNRNISWISNYGELFVGPKNRTMEIGFQIDQVRNQINNFLSSRDNALNPYNPEEINFEVLITSPSGIQFKRFGFYYQVFTENLSKDQFDPGKTDYPWRLRFSPNEVGKWKVEASVFVKSSELIQEFEFEFDCEESHHKGPLMVTKTGTESDRQLYYKQTKEPFYAIATNHSSGGHFTYKPSQNIRQMEGVQEHIEACGNFSRYEISAQGPLPDWENIYNYQGKQDEMFAFDRLINLSEENDLYYILFRHHVELEGPGWDVANWQNNSYRKAFNLSKQSEYFTHPEAIKWQNNNLRYLYSRWGCSPNWTFYGYSELEKFYKSMIQDEGMSMEEAIGVFTTWLVNQQNFVKKELNADALFVSSYGTLAKIELKKGFSGTLRASDAGAIHMYSTVKQGNYEHRAESVDDFWKAFNAPVIIEEMGINDDKLPLYCCTGIEFHNSIWSTAFMGTFGTGMDWWWDRGVQDFDYQKDLALVHAFISSSTIFKSTYSPQRWSDANTKRRLLETFQIISSDKVQGIGWLHNASYYWRNEASINPCIQSLLDSSNLVQTCMVGDNVQLGRNDIPRDYAADYHLDKFTNQGGFYPIQSAKTVADNPTFKIENMNSGFGKNKQWYIVEFFSTSLDRPLEKLESATQIVEANIFGDLVVHTPNLNNENPDVCFKVRLLGSGKNINQIVVR